MIWKQKQLIWVFMENVTGCESVQIMKNTEKKESFGNEIITHQ